MTEFIPISIKMAKKQSLALNPTKISGQCGRLMCCIQYEYACYTDAEEKKGEPAEEEADPNDIEENAAENEAGGK